jgi:hypothetical protein
MPPLSRLALRYLLWFVVLRVLYTLLIEVAGLPSSQATFVILAAAPAVDIGMQAMRHATRPLAMPDWLRVWGLMLAIYVAFNVILPAIFLAPFRSALADPSSFAQIGIILAATGAMMALFLWIGARSSRRPGG